MEIETIKNIATVAAPLTKVVLETFLAPKLNSLNEKWKRQNKIFDSAFENTFEDYLNNSYEKNINLNTLAFKKKKVLLDDVYVPLKIEDSETKNTITIENFNESLFANSSKVLITDTAGMGKSTLSKKLLVSCIKENKGIPILIELRRLSKTKGIVEEIIEQLNPINDSIDNQLILDLIKRGDFIFFFDGYDEIPLNERSIVTKEVQSFILKAGKNKFLLTSRPEDALTSFGDFKKYQIRPLTPDEAFTLLRKYDENGELSNLLIDKINEEDNYRNIEEYLTTPLLVSLLFTAFEHKQRIPFKKHIFYRQVFDALFESHDLSKGESFEREKRSGLGIDEFHRILRILGYLCFTNDNKIEFTRDELQNIVKKSIDFCNDIQCNESDFIRDLIITVPIFNKDGVYFKWSHKSLQEYFSAQFIYLDSKQNQTKILEKMCFHLNNESFINIIDLYKSIDPKGFKLLIEYKLLKDYKEYTERSYIHFSGIEKVERQEYTFGYEIYLINFPFKPETKENHPSKIFALLRKEMKGGRRRMSLGLNVVDDENTISCIKVPEIKTPYQTLIDFLYTKGCEYITKKKSIPRMEQIEIKLKPRKTYKISDRKNAIVNKGENFIKTNELIKYFIGRREIRVINLDKGNEYLRNIESTINSSNNENFLLSF